MGVMYLTDEQIAATQADIARDLDRLARQVSRGVEAWSVEHRGHQTIYTLTVGAELVTISVEPRR